MEYVIVKNSSIQNGTVHEPEILAAIRNKLYFCSVYC